MISKTTHKQSFFKKEHFDITEFNKLESDSERRKMIIRMKDKTFIINIAKDGMTEKVNESLVRILFHDIEMQEYWRKIITRPEKMADEFNLSHNYRGIKPQKGLNTLTHIIGIHHNSNLEVLLKLSEKEMGGNYKDLIIDASYLSHANGCFSSTTFIFNKMKEEITLKLKNGIPVDSCALNNFHEVALSASKLHGAPGYFLISICNLILSTNFKIKGNFFLVKESLKLSLQNFYTAEILMPYCSESISNAYDDPEQSYDDYKLYLSKALAMNKMSISKDKNQTIYKKSKLDAFEYIEKTDCTDDEIKSKNIYKK